MFKYLKMNIFSMPRASTLTKRKLQMIKDKVKSYGKEGIWMSELARNMNIPKSTLWYWLDKKPEQFKDLEILGHFSTNKGKKNAFIILKRRKKEVKP